MFCYSCGKEIENKYIFCPHCGSKQPPVPIADQSSGSSPQDQPHPRRYKLWCFAFWAVLLILCAFMLGHVSYKHDQEELLISLDYQIKSLERTVDNQNSAIRVKDDTIIELRNLKKTRDEELLWYRENVAIVTSSGKRYHHYYCSSLDNSTYVYVYGFNDAEYSGYTPCQTCWESGLVLDK